MQPVHSRILRRLLAILLAAGAYASVSPAVAQSVEQCMTAAPAQAVTLCGNLLDNGSRNADVYHKYASSLYQTGQESKSATVLQQALSLYPSNNKLRNLKEFVDIESSEKRQLEQANQRNQSAVSKGQLKISCRTKNNAQGLADCQRYASLTDEDSDLINKRIQYLRGITGAAPQRPSNPTPVARNEPTPATPAPIPAAPRNNNAALRSLVLNAQTLLNEIGFNAGTPDGLIGGNTRRALKAFYDRTGRPLRTSFDDTTVNDLRQARDALRAAESLLARSNSLASNNQTRDALDTLSTARATSPLLVVPAGLDSRLQRQLNDQSAAQNQLLAEQKAAEEQRAAQLRAEQLAEQQRQEDERQAAEAKRLADARTAQQAEDARRQAEAEAEQQAALRRQQNAANTVASNGNLAQLKSQIRLLRSRLNNEADAEASRNSQMRALLGSVFID